MANRVTRTIIVKAPVEKAYQVWANLENFPHFMKNVKSVTPMGDGSTHWKVKGPLGATVEWDAEITKFEENKRVGWNTKDREGNDVTTSGQVTFLELEQGQTEVTVVMQYEPEKGGVAGDVVAKIFTNPEKQLEEDLQNFKKFIEGRQQYSER